MTEVNLFAMVGMSATAGKRLQQRGNVCNSGGMSETALGGNVSNSVENKYALRDVCLEIVIHNSA